MADIPEIYSMSLYMQVGGTVFCADGNTKAYHKSATYDLRYFVEGTTEGVNCYEGNKHTSTSTTCILSRLWYHEISIFETLQRNEDWEEMKRHGFPIYVTSHDEDVIIRTAFMLRPRFTNGKLEDSVHLSETGYGRLITNCPPNKVYAKILDCYREQFSKTTGKK